MQNVLIAVGLASAFVALVFLVAYLLLNHRNKRGQEMAQGRKAYDAFVNAVGMLQPGQSYRVSDTERGRSFWHSFKRRPLVVGERKAFSVKEDEDGFTVTREQ